MQLKSFFLKFWIAGLTFSAGAVNSVCLFRFAAPVSHHSGNITQMAIVLTAGLFTDFLKIFLIIFFFFTGAFTSGFIFHRRSFELKKHFGILLAFPSLIFLMFHIFSFTPLIILCASSAVLGLQNGMFIFYEGILIRTTHLTGYITDAAFFLGTIIRGNKKKIKEVLFYTVNIAAFLLGAASAAFVSAGYSFLYLSGLYFFSVIYYFVLRLNVLKKL